MGRKTPKPRNPSKNKREVVQVSVNRPRRKASRGIKRQTRIDECSARYAIAISDPWSPHARGACVPTHPSRPSQKVTAYREIIATVGTSGYGFIMLAPCVANDLNCVWYSNSNFAANTPNVSANVTQVGTSGVGIPNIPFTSAQCVDLTQYGKPAIAGRVVSASISAQYIGTELNRGGNVVCFTDPDHQSVNNISFDETISRAEADIGVPNSSRSECWCTSYGLEDIELSYPDAPSSVSTTNGLTLACCFPYSRNVALAPTGSSDTGLGTPIMIIIFTGTAGNQYRCRVVEHLEYVGKAGDAVLTPNSTSAVGFEIVQNAASLLASMKAAKLRVPLSRLMREALSIAYNKITSPEALKLGMTLLASL